MTNEPTAFKGKEQSPGPMLCLSGGGFRATLFHLGAARRLNEFGVLAQLDTVTSVSGGSILNGVLAKVWPHLIRGADAVFTNFDEVVGQPIREFCGKDLRTPLLVGRRLNPLRWPELIRNFGAISGNALADAYQPLLGTIRLTELDHPVPNECPRFIFCATNVRTGACWQFHCGPGSRMGDFYSGYTDTVGVLLAEAVAASSAFPPGFAALALALNDRAFSREDPWGQERPVSKKRQPIDRQFARRVLLTDGGVYDNLGVEPVWTKRGHLLVSDAGSPFRDEAACPQRISARLKRAVAISMEQVGAVRKRWLVEEFRTGRRGGALWALNTPIADYGLADSRTYGSEALALLSGVRTDLNAFSKGEIASLENHGYALADAAIRSRASKLCATPGVEFSWPHPELASDSRACCALRRSSSRTLLSDLWRYATAGG